MRRVGRAGVINIDKFETNFAIGIYKRSNICYNAEKEKGDIYG